MKRAEILSKIQELERLVSNENIEETTMWLEFLKPHIPKIISYVKECIKGEVMEANFDDYVSLDLDGNLIEVTLDNKVISSYIEDIDIDEDVLLNTVFGV